MKSEQARQENKHKKQWDELLFRNETSLRELEQLQVGWVDRLIRVITISAPGSVAIFIFATRLKADQLLK